MKKGYVMLTTVMLIAAVAALIIPFSLMASAQNSQIEAVKTQAAQARYLALACAERALDRLKNSLLYAGSETISWPEGSCQILPLGGLGNTNRSIQTSGSVGSVIQKVEVEVTLVNPLMQVASYLEVK